MSFERPLLILFAFLFIPALVLGSRFFRSIFTLEIPLGPPGGSSFRAPAGLGVLIKILRTLELAGVFLFLIAAAGPRFTFTETLWLSRGADIIFVLDISPSMAGLDMDGRSRFDLSRRLIRDFAEKRPPDAIGLAALGSDAALLLPPTIDREALYTRLDTLRIGELGDGTALGTGIATAALHLGDSSAPRRALVLISDGENNGGSVHPETAAALLPELGISFWIIAVGSGGEVSFDYVDPETRRRRTGKFDSRFDSESLRSLARKGGGTLVLAPQADAFAAAFARLDNEEMVIRRGGIQTRSRPFHAPVLITALILVGASHFIRRYVLGALL